MTPTYSFTDTELEWLRAQDLKIALTNAGSFPTDIRETTLAQIAAAEPASSGRWSSRIAFSPPASVLESASKRRTLSFTFTIPATASAFTIDRANLLLGASSTLANSATGSVAFVGAVSSLTIPANDPGLLRIRLFSGDPGSTFT